MASPPSRCHECRIELTPQNRAFPNPKVHSRGLDRERDPMAAFCSSCFSWEGSGWDPACGTCQSPLEQDILNPFRVFCPAGHEIMILQPVCSN